MVIIMKKVNSATPVWQIRALTLAIGSLMITNLAHASAERHGDLEIYKGAEAGTPVVTLMLDVSGSMATVDYPASGCSYNGNNYYRDTSYGFEALYCLNNGKKYFRRIDDLKMGVIDLVNSPELQSKVKIGVGIYPDPDENGGSAEISGHGKITIPTKILDDAQKNKIITYIRTLKPTWNTPIAQSYGEVGSYMLGTKTSGTEQQYSVIYREVYKDYQGRSSLYKDEQCKSWDNFLSAFEGKSFKNLLRCRSVGIFGGRDWSSNWPKDVVPLKPDHIDLTKPKQQVLQTANLEKDGIIPVQVFGSEDDVTYGVPIEEDDPVIQQLIRDRQITEYPIKFTVGTENPYSGYNKSVDAAKVPGLTKYDTPITSSQCAGNAIYFLTDGYPNNSSTAIAKSVMNKALKPVGSSTQALQVECSGGGQQAWPCIFDFADKLLNKNNPTNTSTDPAKPNGIPIKTATVGFGSLFSSVAGAKTDADCNRADSTDVANTCKWGLRGQGGFYYAANSQDIVTSVTDLVSGLTTEIPPISTGSMAVPLDDLNVSTSRKFAYLPLLDPKPLSPYKLWKGNLKKYKIKNGTLVDVNDKAVFMNKNGEFATNTYDLYNTLADTTRPDVKRPDNAKPQIGGSFQHIFENSNSRKLYVNQGGALKAVGADSVTATAKPVGFEALTDYSNTQKQQLLYFLGYPVANDLAVDPTKPLGVAFDSSRKQLGGVLHSLPQLISKQALLTNGKIDNSRREDYVLYGSLDGALHVIRDTDSGTSKAGEEVFTFIPKQVLDQQGETFVDPDKVGTSAVFGVDGPWSVFTNYKYSSSKVEALQSLAFGGLRMGGSTYYGIDLSNLNQPKLIYSIGSTYATDGSDNAKGIKNDIVATDTSNSSEQKAYARMGLSFAEPSLGYVMKNGKRVMVNFLPGGYDRCYEDPNFKLGSTITTNTIAGCNGKTRAQGNGIYMVQVGQEKVDSISDTNPNGTNESSFDTSRGNGNLLWWASNDNNGAGTVNFTKVDDMTHSIVTEVRALDRNYDGLTDQLYFADLGGRVWRVDINNSVDTDSFKVDRVVKMLDLSATGTNTAMGNITLKDSTGASVTVSEAPPRIYEKPLVTFTRLGSGTDIVGLVTVGTGDRSSPVTSERSVADRIYTFVDRDIARPNLFCYDVSSTSTNECDGVTNTLTQTSAITPANLVPLTTNNAGQFTNDATIKTQIDAYTKLGWYLPLTMWSTTTKNAAGVETTTVTTNNKGIKMFNQPDAIAGLLFTTAFNPKVGDTSDDCKAGVTGQTQREQLCLPYGVCMSKAVDNEGALTGQWTVRQNRYVSNAGIGIVDNIIADGNFTGDTKNSVTVLENFCEDADCSPGKTELTINPVTESLSCSGNSCKVVTDAQLDPMQWKER